jgi:FixJ family two-component response regulator
MQACISDITAGIKTLSEREREVFILASEHGLTSASIAGLLVISKRTVEVHRANILEKTGAGTFNRLSYVWGMTKHDRQG